MCRSIVIIAFCSLIATQMVTPAAAENPQVYNSGPYSGPMVSPYLNLGVTQTGLSNYQTLVRPMIEDREALTRQSANINKLQAQLRDAQRHGSSEPSSTDGKPRAGSVRFMHYSHYFNRLP